MRTPLRRGPAPLLLPFLLLVLLLTAALVSCGRDATPTAGEEPEEAWLDLTLEMMDEIGARLGDPARLEAFATRLESGEEGWALLHLGLEPSRLKAWEARLRPLLEASALRHEPSLPAGGGIAPTRLGRLLRRDGLPPRPSAKDDRMLCAVQTLYADLIWCGEHSYGLGFTLCAVAAYYHYLQVLRGGCGG